MTIGAGGLGNEPGYNGRAYTPDSGYDLVAERRIFDLKARAIMSDVPQRYPHRYTTEGRMHSMDFAPMLPDGVTLDDTGVSWVASVYAEDEGNTDSSPDSILIDDPVVSGTKVIQFIRGGVDKVTYKHVVSVATSNGQTLVEHMTSKVVAP